MAQDALTEALEAQIEGCRRFGSPFSAALSSRVVAEAAVGGAFRPLLAEWAERPVEAILAAAVPLRLLAALHDLVLGGEAPALAAQYPAATSDPDWGEIERLLPELARRHADRFASFMATPPQTNEVGRSYCLLGGFLTVAKETGLPLRCLELGASAGLNTLWDRYFHRLAGGRGWGDPASPVRLAGDWTGGLPPLDAVVQVRERRAVDRSPIGLSDPPQARRLLAYVWPDQPERLARLHAAIELARAAEVSVEAAEAADWAERHALPQPGVATVLYHSVFWQYPEEATRNRLRSAIAAAAAASSREAPFGWLRMEPDADFRFEVRLSLWPGGEDRCLAVVHPHGASVEWSR